MTYRQMALLPLVWVAAFALAAVLLPGDAAGGVFLFENESSKVLGLIGCVVAASTFDRGDYLRRAWSLHAWCYVLLLARDVFRRILGVDTLVAGVSAGAIGSVIVLLANVAAVAGTLMLARAWSFAGLELPGSRGARRALVVGAAVLGLAISGAPLYDDTVEVLHGNAIALTGGASELGDIVSLCLVAPLLLTAIAVRGGVLKWPWALLTASMLFWLVYDLAATIDPFGADHSLANKALREGFRALACVYGFSAGLAQRRAITEPAPASAAE